MKRESEMRADIKADIRRVFSGKPDKAGKPHSVYGLGVLSVGQIGEYVGLHYNSVMAYMSGYEYFKVGTKKVFHINDVADRIMRDRRIAI
jgi:hypothetical protein